MDFTCRQCSEPIAVGGRGRPRKFCSEACRKRHGRANRLPVELTSRDRWVRHVKKRPITPAGRPASSTNGATWSSHAAAKRSRVGHGLGFVLGDGVGCVDLDHVIDDRGRLAPAAEAFVRSLPTTYTEISPSGHGLHLWFLMDEAPGSVRHVGGVSVETYSTGRYITVTGDRWPGTPLSLARSD